MIEFAIFWLCFVLVIAVIVIVGLVLAYLVHVFIDSITYDAEDAFAAIGTLFIVLQSISFATHAFNYFLL